MTPRNLLLTATALTAFVLAIAAAAVTHVPFAVSTVTVDAAAPSPTATTVATRGTEPAPAVAPDMAAVIAAAAAPGTHLLRAPELVDAQGRAAYEVTLDRGTVYVDAGTGAVVADTALAPSSAPAPASQAEREHPASGHGGESSGDTHERGHDDG